MSNDPKHKPLDPSPSDTPDILQRDLNLDRRERRVPSFEELKTNVVMPSPAMTQPGMPGPFARPGPTPPIGTVAPGNPNKQPSHFEVAPTTVRPQVTAAPAQTSPTPQATRAPVSQVPPGLQPRAAAPRPAAPAAPRDEQRTQSHRPPEPPKPASTTGRAPAHGNLDVTRAGVLPRQAPPSPSEYAAARAAPTNDAPTVPVVPIRVTAAAPTQGASIPSGHYSKGSYALPHVPVAPPQPTAPEFITAPDRKAVPRPPPPAPAPLQSMPNHLRVTQPEMRNPFLARRDTPIVAATPATMEAPPPPGPTRVIEPHGPPPPVTTAPPSSPDFGEVPVFEEVSLEDEPAESFDDVSPGDVVAAPATLWRRTFAWMFDLGLIALVVSGFFGAALAVIGKPSVALLVSVALPALGVVGVVAFVYTTLFAFLWSGRTPGRRILGIQLVDSSGRAPHVGRALVRAVLSLASFGLFLSGFWLALFDRRGQTLHDKLTSTFVVRLKPAV